MGNSAAEQENGERREKSPVEARDPPAEWQTRARLAITYLFTGRLDLQPCHRDAAQLPLYSRSDDGSCSRGASLILVLRSPSALLPPICATLPSVSLLCSETSHSALFNYWPSTVGAPAVAHFPPRGGSVRDAEMILLAKALLWTDYVENRLAELVRERSYSDRTIRLSRI